MNDRRGLALGSATVILVATAVYTTAIDAHAATGPVTSGSGWKLRPGVTHIDTRPWTIAFHDTTSRTKLTGYLRKNAAELTHLLGIRFNVTTKLIPASTTRCAPNHTITYRWQSKPDPKHPNRSFAASCTWNNKPYSSSIYINSDYWSPTRRYPEWQRLNVIWHESAHAAGLSHPNTCPRDRNRLQPLMCADTYKDLRTRRYSSFEQTAFRHLVTNRIYAAAQP